MDKVHEAAKMLLELAWWVQRKGPLRSGLQPLPVTERAILRYVDSHQGQSVSEVALALDMKSSNVSSAVRALIKRGLMEKTADEHDKRKSLLYLTELAEKNKKDINSAVTGSLEAVLEELSPETRDSIFASLDALGEVTVRLRSHG